VISAADALAGLMPRVRRDGTGDVAGAVRSVLG